MPSKHDGIEKAETPSGDAPLAESAEKQHLRSQTISVTIPASRDDELDDDDVILDDVAVSTTDAVVPPRREEPAAPAQASSTPASPPAPAKKAPATKSSAAAAQPKTGPALPAKASAATKSAQTKPKNSAGAPSGAATPSRAPAPRAAAVKPEAPEASPTPAPEPEQSTPQSMSARRAPNGGAENAEMLTAERLLDDRGSRNRAPDGAVQRALYAASGHLINLGDSKKARARKELTHRIAKPFVGSARFVPVLTRKGGVGKTTVSLLLGMALADARDDRVIAIDANPDRGTLLGRIGGQSDYTVRDVIRRKNDITGYTEFSTLVARDETRLDVLASDSDPAATAAFGDDDYATVATLASRYYSMVLTDSGTGMVHDVMRATIERADSVVIVSGTSIDEARLTSETISWLEANGYAPLAKNAVVVINNRSAARSLVKLDELEAHFASRVRAVVRLPYDPALASGSSIEFGALRGVTQHAARKLAASVVDGIPVQRPTLTAG
ncbi:MinD/ParA family ATP-binding protein [Paramicrobacterium fandaimingii]|uniref:MinD/ParA family ATP-binding protein n=1 Tax=Paramicrobacterium fandaimingii TaxID=2708079 RepID=UPI001F2F7C3F|nr:AAA family ATPase [Microbacterium fandaimingii]